jgi:hypothetical protein
MRRPIYNVALLALTVFLLSLTLSPRITSISIKGSYHPNKGDKVSINLYNLDTKQNKLIESDKHKFLLNIPIDTRTILTLKTDKGKAKSIYVNTCSRKAIERPQQFIVNVGMQKKTFGVGGTEKFAPKCVGTILFNELDGKLEYNKKSVIVDKLKLEKIRKF